MKIAIDARMYGNKQCTGIGTYVRELTQALFELDRENEYLLFMRETEINDPDYQENYPNVRKIIVKSPWYSYQEQIRLPFEILREKFDIIHFPHFNSPLFMPRKSICTIHDVTPLFFPGHKMSSQFRKLAHRTVFQNTINRANKVIAISEATKSDIIKYFHKPQNEIKVIYEGVDESFAKTENSGIINSVKNKYNLPENYLLYVGVWRNHKNLETLVRGFEILKEKYNFSGNLVIAGRPDLHATNVTELIKNSKFKKFIFTPGYIDNADLATVYSSATLFVLPSFIEGFGLITLEAQFCGVPVLVSDIPVLHEVLTDSAIYFDPKSADNLAMNAWGILNNPKQKQILITKGLLNKQKFSWAKCAEQTLQTYREIFSA
ncbi:MAG: glycosyltransferase family 1 protein [Patescibacteria group bacterium]